MIYPRPLRTFHLLELTTYCNLKCSYCPSPQKWRPHQHMSEQVFARALEWLGWFYDKPAPLDWTPAVLGVPATCALPLLNLHGIGESLLHPDYFDLVSRVRTRCPRTVLVMSSNGILLSRDTCAKLASLDVKINISLHRSDLARDAIQNAQDAGILNAVSVAPSTEPNDWAGQLNWHVRAPRDACTYLHQGWGVILVDGQITTCCLDAKNQGIIGNVSDPPSALPMAPYSLCKTCHRVP